VYAMSYKNAHQQRLSSMSPLNPRFLLPSLAEAPGNREVQSAP
jgi:hypothetical protein